LHHRRTKAFKTISARVVFHTDLDDATAARALVPRVLGRGTQRLPSLREFQVELDRLYGAGLAGDVRKMGERHLVQIRGEWIMDRLADEPITRAMGALFAEFLHEPATENGMPLRAAFIEQERKMMADEADAVFDDKGRYARHRLVEEMCRGEPYARPSIGRADEIRALEVGDVRQAYRMVVERAPADVFMVGNVSWRDALHFAKGLALGDRVCSQRLRRTKRRRVSRARTRKESQPVGQAKLEMGFRTGVKLGSTLYAPLVLMNALFGGTAVGKLFKTVREKASLCYSIGSAIERTKGLLIVHAGIDERNYARARRLILAQLDELRRGEIDPAAFDQVRGIMISAVNSLRDSPSGLIDFAVERQVNAVEPDLEKLLAQLEAVTPGHVARAARTVELDTVFLLQGSKSA